MEIKRNGIVITVEQAVIERLVLERLQHEELPPQALITGPTVLPRIGSSVMSLGGVFAGVMRGRADLFEGRDYMLIVGPEHDDELQWKPANDWAEGLKQHLFADWSGPYRKEQALAFANVPELFKAEWYWSREQRASDSDYAWGQTFYDGSQDDLGKDDRYRVRAVRRVPIQ